MTVACAPFKQLSVSPTVSLYYLMDEDGNEQTAVRAVQRAHELCTAWFGPLSSQVLSIVEIPEGYGGEAADHLILIPAGKFKGDDQTVYRRFLSQLGHELIHLWNTPSREKVASRFLDEAITHYVQALLLREEFGEDAYWEQMGRYRSYFLSAGEAAHAVPLAEAGVHDWLTEPVSSGKGPWALCVLHHVLGDQLLPALRTFFDRYRDQGATLKDFQATITEIDDVDLEPFFHDWLWGTASSALLALEMGEKALAAALAGRYGLNERSQSSG
jgi:predicted metalloprotease with PDZ domain